jgi:DNA repair protein RecN (Recombination protein N)
VLRELHIENFALIQELTVFFGDGLNILTGETGAGKSIIIDALNQVLGERASAELVRTGSSQAVITAVVDVNDAVAAYLEEQGLGAAEQGRVILQREIYSNGKSQARIDGRPVTVALLKEVGSLLVEIHGQHEHQSLLDEGAHIQMVDAFGGQPVLSARADYQQTWEELLGLNRELAGLHGDARERERLLDILQYQVDEIAAAALKPGEEEELLAQRKLLSNARKLLEVCQSSYQVLYHGEGDNPVVQILATVVNSLKDFRELDGTLEQACSQLEESLYAVEDAARQLRSFADAFTFDPQQLEAVEQRLDLINDLKRKYADSIQGILAWQQEKQAEIEKIKNTEIRHAQLTQLIAEVREKAGRQAEALSGLRREAGRELAAAIEAELAYLQMEKTRFEVQFSCQDDESGLPVGDRCLRAGGQGIDNVRFMISPNPGEPMKPLAKIASGGEMSRIMLAILNVLAKLRPVDTMVFDEIDAGIGGRAAQAVAEKLSAVSDRRQVICVSHLPQVTSMADTHLYIYKEVEGGRTVTKVSRLDMEGRVQELARMLGGAEVTSATINHAKEMLSLASKTKLK